MKLMGQSIESNMSGCIDDGIVLDTRMDVLELPNKINSFYNSIVKY